MKTQYVLFRVEGNPQAVDAQVRNLLNMWRTNHHYPKGINSPEHEVALSVGAEIVEAAEMYSEAQNARKETTTELIHGGLK